MKTVLAAIAADRATGPVKQLVQLASKLRERGSHRIVFACTWPKGLPEPPLFQDLRGQGHEVHVLAQRAAVDPLLLCQASRLIRETGAHVLQTHGYKPNVMGLILSKATGSPWVSFIHGNTNENAKIRFYFRLERLFARHADRIVAVSGVMRGKLVEAGFPGDRTVAVPNAVASAAPVSGPAEASTVNREDFGLSARDTVLGVVGRFSPEKGHGVFLEAMNLLKGRDGLKAILVGDGQEEAALKRFCETNGLSGRVVFAGYQPEIAPFYRLMDVLVIPSFSEGMPNVALEAMACGLPVVASAVGGVPETVPDRVTGRLVPPGDPRALAEAIIETVDDPETARAWGEAGLARVRELFSPDARAARMESIYSEAARRHGGTA
ncbi:glycosyltransferase family 4 protein [Fundidesulfovibrio terrae]|uniref:glycosyltransferase family 4 protein n=1 Tax=Fundidesulfovibrio terrae TaxID=2922866 RepID=UPI001FAEBF0E|nr:glycosyltransferase family 4 protein [Fundidesulfovibrio terrae]